MTKESPGATLHVVRLAGNSVSYSHLLIRASPVYVHANPKTNEIIHFCTLRIAIEFNVLVELIDVTKTLLSAIKDWHQAF